MAVELTVGHLSPNSDCFGFFESFHGGQTYFKDKCTIKPPSRYVHVHRFIMGIIDAVRVWFARYPAFRYWMQRREAKIGLRDRKCHQRPKERNDTGENPHRNGPF